MHAFMLTVFVSSIIGALLRGLMLSVMDYPRSLKVMAGNDVFAMFLSIAFAAWAAYLLWGA